MCHTENMQKRQKCFLGFCCVSTVLVLFTLYFKVDGIQHFMFETVCVNMEMIHLVLMKTITNYDIKTERANQEVLPLLSETKVEVFPNWTTQDPHDRTFIRRVYLYSAIIDIHTSSLTTTNVHLTAFQDGTFFSPLTCCAQLVGRSEYRAGRTMIDHAGSNILPNKSLSRTLTFVGAVFRCQFPFSASELRGARVTLATTSCPVNVNQYLTVHEPLKKPGGLAICAKVAFGHHLDPYKLVEWFETQWLLGVDTIELFECNNTELVYKIFHHYQQLGLLTLLPFTLPGRPWGRNFLAGNNDWTRWNDETELPIWDCRLRLAGHEYIMDLDMDEIVMPKNMTLLKPLFKELFKDPKVSGVHFRPQFFIEDWSPVNRVAPLLFLQFLNSTGPMQTGKEAYMPSRTHQARTHNSFPYKGYRRYVADPSIAVLHHYRKWKSLWKWKPSRTLIDRSMEKLQAQLVPNVMAVREKMGMKQTV